MYDFADGEPGTPGRLPTPWSARRVPASFEYGSTIRDAEDLARLLPCRDADVFQLGSGPCVAEVQSATPGGLECNWFRLHCDLQASGGTPGPMRGLFMVLGSPGDWCLQKQPLHPGQVVPWPGAEALDVFARSQGEAITVLMRDDLLNSLFGSLLNGPSADRLRSGGIVQATPKATRAFEEQVRGILEGRRAQPARPPGVDAEESPARCLAVLARLLESSEPAEPTPGRGDRVRVVREAEAFMDRRLNQPLTAEDVCKAIDVSRRTLFYAFEELYGISPMRYLRAKRLNMVRRELRGGSSDRVSIQQVARRWHLGHSAFSSQYLRLFGELPSATLARGPGPDGPPPERALDTADAESLEGDGTGR